MTPRRESNSRRISPTAVGGMTSGREQRTSTMVRAPVGILRVAAASARARGKIQRVLIAATRRVNRINERSAMGGNHDDSRAGELPGEQLGNAQLCRGAPRE